MSKTVPFQKTLSFSSTPASEQAAFMQGRTRASASLPARALGRCVPLLELIPRQPDCESGFSPPLPRGAPAEGEQSQPVVSTTPPPCGFIKAVQSGPAFSIMFHMPWRRVCVAQLLGTAIQ